MKIKEKRKLKAFQVVHEAFAELEPDQIRPVFEAARILRGTESRTEYRKKLRAQPKLTHREMG